MGRLAVAGLGELSGDFGCTYILWSCRIFESVKAGREEVHGKSLSGAVAGSGRRFVAGDRSPVRGVFALRARRGDVRACGRSGVYCSLDG